MSDIVTYATSGTIKNDFRTGYRIQISWTVNSQNIANNTSNVTVKAQLVSTGSYYTINSTATKNGSLTINGTKYSFTFSAKLSANQTKTVYTKTVDIPHNSDGTKTLSMSTSLGIAVTLSGAYWGTVTASGSGTLNTIPRTSTISLSASSVAVGSAITVNITRASTDFTHKVYYTFGSKSITISSSATTSASYTIPTDHATVIPNATSGSATITVDTYNGSTKIGSASKSFTVTVPSSLVPTISSVTVAGVDAGASVSTYGYIKGKSKCKVTINGAAGSYGSTIKSYYITGAGFSSSSQSFTTGTLMTAGSFTFSGYVIDSRGRKSAIKTSSAINVQDYFSPIIEYFTCFRCDSSGVKNDNGTYAKVSFEDTFTAITGNITTNKIEYKAASATTWTNAGSATSNKGLIIGAGNLSTASTYNIRVTVSDKFETVTKTANIAPSFVTLDFKKGGKGIAIGKAAETDNLLDIAINTKVGVITLGAAGTLQVGSSGSTLNCTSSAFTYKGNKIYHAGSKPTPSEIGAIATSASCNKNWNWSGQSGQPNWIWGGNDGTNMYVYNPSNFNVNWAAGSSYAQEWRSKNYGTSYLTTGNGDAATWSTHNTILRTHWGLGVRDYTDTCRFLIDARTGNTFAKGYFMGTAFNTSSDRRLKEDIKPIDTKLEKMFMELKAVNYYMIDQEDHRRHNGFIAQDVEEAMLNNNISYEEFAGLLKRSHGKETHDIENVPKQILEDETDSENIEYSLNYGEFTALNTHMIQKCLNLIQEQQDEIEKLKDEIIQLKK